MRIDLKKQKKIIYCFRVKNKIAAQKSSPPPVVANTDDFVILYFRVFPSRTPGEGGTRPTGAGGGDRYIIRIDGFPIHARDGDAPYIYHPPVPPGR